MTPKPDDAKPSLAERIEALVVRDTASARERAAIASELRDFAEEIEAEGKAAYNDNLREIAERLGFARKGEAMTDAKDALEELKDIWRAVAEAGQRPGFERMERIVAAWEKERADRRIIRMAARTNFREKGRAMIEAAGKDAGWQQATLLDMAAWCKTEADALDAALGGGA